MNFFCGAKTKKNLNLVKLIAFLVAAGLFGSTKTDELNKYFPKNEQDYKVLAPQFINSKPDYPAFVSAYSGVVISQDATYENQSQTKGQLGLVFSGSRDLESITDNTSGLPCLEINLKDGDGIEKVEMYEYDPTANKRMGPLEYYALPNQNGKNKTLFIFSRPQKDENMVEIKVTDKKGNLYSGYL